jgi:uncharacterized protein
VLRFLSKRDTVRFDPVDFEPRIATRLLILQPTPFCNVDCSYCYLPDRDNKSRMSAETAGLAARRLAEGGLLGEDLTVVWHAGEPLVLPVAYYEEAISAIAVAIGGRCKVTHSIQTNATLIDDAWCRFFVDHQVKVGVSIDGPAELHDLHRKTRSGKGTHAVAMAGLDALRRHGIPHHAIAVVTSAALDQADAIHSFFREAGVREVGFNFDEAEGPHAASSIGGQEEGHRAFIERMLEHMIDSAGQFQVRELAYAFRQIADGFPKYRWKNQALPDNGQTVPFAIVNVSWNGDFSTFSPELLGQKSLEYADFVLGNVHSEGFLDAARGEAFARLWHDVRQSVAACESVCEYFNYCGGGSPANKLYENGSMNSAETLYCRSMIQRPFEAALGVASREP